MQFRLWRAAAFVSSPILCYTEDGQINIWLTSVHIYIGLLTDKHINGSGGHKTIDQSASKLIDNNNNQDNVYGAVIMTEPLRELGLTRFIWWM